MALGSRSALALIAAASLALLCGYDLAADTLGGTSVRGLAQKHWWKQRQQWRRRHERYERFLDKQNGLQESRHLPYAKRVTQLVQVEAENQFLTKAKEVAAEQQGDGSGGAPCIDTVITVTTTIWGNEVGIKIDDAELVVQGTLKNNQEYKFNMCLSAGTHVAKLEDSYGDGWHGSYMSIGGVDYGKEFLSGAVSMITFSASSSCVETTMTVTTTAGGFEMGLKIDDIELVAQGSLANNQVYTFTMCLSIGLHTAALLDSYADGWHGGYLTINGVDYGRDFLTGTVATHQFTVSCVSTTMTVTTKSWGPEIGLTIDGTVIIAEGSLYNFQVYTYTVCLSSGSHEANLLDSYGDGWHGGFLTIGGVDYGKEFLTGTMSTHTFYVGCIDTLMKITTTTWGSEAGLAIDGNELAAQGSLSNYQEYTYTVCLSPGVHEANLLDSYGDGWHHGYLTINGIDYGRDFLTGTSQVHTFNVGGPATGAPAVTQPEPSTTPLPPLEPSPTPEPSTPTPSPSPLPSPSPSPSPHK